MQWRAQWLSRNTAALLTPLFPSPSLLFDLQQTSLSLSLSLHLQCFHSSSPRSRLVHAKTSTARRSICTRSSRRRIVTASARRAAARTTSRARKRRRCTTTYVHLRLRRCAAPRYSPLILPWLLARSPHARCRCLSLYTLYLSLSARRVAGRPCGAHGERGESVWCQSRDP